MLDDVARVDQLLEEDGLSVFAPGRRARFRCPGVRLPPEHAAALGDDGLLRCGSPARLPARGCDFGEAVLFVARVFSSQGGGELGAVVDAPAAGGHVVLLFCGGFSDQRGASGFELVVLEDAGEHCEQASSAFPCELRGDGH